MQISCDATLVNHERDASQKSSSSRAGVLLDRQRMPPKVMHAPQMNMKPCRRQVTCFQGFQAPEQGGCLAHAGVRYAEGLDLQEQILHMQKAFIVQRFA